MPAWLALPTSTGSAPGVVVLHDVFGMSRDHRNQANWLAEPAFSQSLPIFTTRAAGSSASARLFATSLPASVRLRRRRSLPKLAFLQPGCNGRIGVVGFCMGGGFALLLASGHGFSAASVNYGGPLPKNVDDFLNSACPVVGSYGAWPSGSRA